VCGPGEKLPETAFRVDYLVQGCGGKLCIVQGQQVLESRDSILCELNRPGFSGGSNS
jgi:hypothetical protein